MGGFFLRELFRAAARVVGAHEANENALKSLRPVFGMRLRNRFPHVRRRNGIAELGKLKLNVAVKKKLCRANPVRVALWTNGSHSSSSH
jgi:hypothetical protein